MCKSYFDILADIEKAYKKASDLGFFRYVFKIPDLIFHPRRFWKEYDKLSFKSRLFQFLTYASLYAFALWLMPYKDLSIKELWSYLTIQSVGIIVYAAIAYLSNVIFGKRKGLFTSLLLLCLYIKFIGSFVHLIVIKIYYYFEDPLALTVAAVIPLVVELLNFSHAAFICQKNKYKIFGVFFISLVILNIYDYAKIYFNLDGKYNPYYFNLIVVEKDNQANSLNYFYDVPSYISYNKNDSVDGIIVHDISLLFENTKKIDLHLYNSKLKDDIDSIRVIINRCQYKMNKDLFQDLLDIKKDMLTINESKTFSEAPMIFAGHLLSHGRSIECYAIKEYDRSLVNRNFYAFEKYDNILKQHQEAFAVNQLGYLWHPVRYYLGTTQYINGKDK